MAKKSTKSLSKAKSASKIVSINEQVNEQANLLGGKINIGSKRAHSCEHDECLSFAGPHKPIPDTSYDGTNSHPIDRMIQATIGQFTLGISPIPVYQAFYDWGVHLYMAPGKQTELAKESLKNFFLRSTYISRCIKTSGKNERPKPVITPNPRDHRFDDPEWEKWPYNFYVQNFLLAEDWWDKATKNIRGASRHHLDVVNFVTRQIMDIFSPGNFPATNPRVIKKTFEEKGRNFVQGFQNYIDDITRTLDGSPPEGAENFIPGKAVAITKGKVIYRNRLIELIQYSPQTKKVNSEPVLIVPAWIMKYYILDLSPHNSLVNYLVSQGHTVFIISWKNPDAKDRDLGFEDYLNLGVFESIQAIENILPNRKINAMGYCLGGTLLMVAAAWLARRKNNILNSISLLAAQIDFEEAGELMLFIDESQISFLEDVMWQQGYLDQHQMAGAFNLLRSNDLIWSRIINNYMMGQRRPINDLMAWNADATRMPYRMHSQYLRNLYLNNELSEGHFKVNGETISLTDIKAPIFAVGTVKDHVAPWYSVYKINLFTDTEVTFVLTTGGHNAGIVSEPGHPHRHYQIRTQSKDGAYLTPERWAQTVPRKDGSWWPEWIKWARKKSKSKEMVNPPQMGNEEKGYPPLADAPGTYVYLR